MPRISESNDSVRAQAALRSDMDELEIGQPIRILAVDDEGAVLRALRMLFRGGDYEIYLADSGGQALELLSQQRIDVILSDLRMPEMDGQAFLTEVKRRFPELMRIVLSGCAEPSSVISVLNEAGIFAYVNKPWDNVDLQMKVRAAAEQRRLKRLTEWQNEQLVRLNQSLEDRVVERTAQLANARDRLQRTMLDLDESYRAIVRMLAHVTELRVPAARGHGQRVARTARRLAQSLQLPRREIRDIETAALLHDIGLVVVADEILDLPPERMTEDQRRQFERHPMLGEITLMGIPAMRQVAAMVRSHHEFHDGSGYPDGLAGEAIPLGARIVALANDFEDLLNGEATGEPMTEEDARNRLCRDAGHRYEPGLVERFVRLDDVLPEAGGIEVEEVCALRSADLKPGMVLYEKLVSKDGMLLLNAGQRVTSQAIDAIRRLERGDGSRYLIYVYAQPEEETEDLSAAY